MGYSEVCVGLSEELEPGPVMLRTTLRRADGTEHGAYFAAIARVR